MEFPFHIEVLGLRLHPHPVFELLGYILAGQLYWHTRKRFPRAVAASGKNLWVVLGAMLGAVAGAKLLGWFEHWGELIEDSHDLHAWIGGKSVVGAILGGWIGVEIAKRLLRVRHSTGDAFTFPLIVGMAVGRLGCFFTGLEDRTHGVETSLPWGVDFGDGITRHPCQLYDIAFLTLLGLAMLAALLRARRRHKPLPNGILFRSFILSYCLWRLAVEFIKPRAEVIGPLSAIQLACIAGAIAATIAIITSRPAPDLDAPNP